MNGSSTSGLDPVALIVTLLLVLLGLAFYYFAVLRPQYKKGQEELGREGEEL